MRVLRWCGGLVVSFLCLVGPLISLRAIVYGVLITAGITVGFLVIGAPSDSNDKEVAQLVGTGGDIDEAQVYALSIDRGMKQVGHVVKHWGLAFIIMIVVIGLLFVISFLSRTEYATTVSKRGDAEFQLTAQVFAHRYQRELEEQGVIRRE